MDWIEVSQIADGFELRDSLIALPRRFLLFIACIPLLTVGLGAYLIFSDSSESVRAGGVLLITLSASGLTIAIGLGAAARVRTDDIDRLVARWLAGTLEEKLRAYLVGSSSRGSPLYPALFRSVEAFPDPSTSSFCVFELIDLDDKPYYLYAKSNILNVEVGFYVALTDIVGESHSGSLHIVDLESLAKHRDDPRVNSVADTLHGAISEGYSAYISNGRNGDGSYVTYRLRQKLERQFITSPYMRRYFAEDVAIMSYWFYAEMRSGDNAAISGSRGPLSL